jgi:SAM-dependent methyltransferase
MSWFQRRKPARPASGPGRLETGVHRSPALARLCQDLARHRPESILDLGASSTENLRLLSRYTANLCIQDLFHAACEESGLRSAVFRFAGAESVDLPAGDRFDVVLMWDLLHYFEPADLPLFIARLAGVCRPGALVMLMASSVAAIPLVPIRFKIETEDTLHYSVPEGERMAPGGLQTRQVETIMAGFEPVRCFQLRNGLQEFLFRYAGAEEETSSQLTLADLEPGG